MNALTVQLRCMLDHMELYSSEQVVKISGLTERQLDYWTRAEAIWPTQPAEGSGSRIRWSRSDLRRLILLRNAREFIGDVDFLSELWRRTETEDEIHYEHCHLDFVFRLPTDEQLQRYIDAARL